MFWFHNIKSTSLVWLLRDRSSHSKRQETESDVLVSGINPMEFIDVACSPPSAMDDDVFVNLDAFDMLGDFPELEVLDSNHSGKCYCT